MPMLRFRNKGNWKPSARRTERLNRQAPRGPAQIGAVDLDDAVKIAALDRFTNPTKREPFESIPEW